MILICFSLHFGAEVLRFRCLRCLAVCTQFTDHAVRIMVHWVIRCTADLQVDSSAQVVTTSSILLTLCNRPMSQWRLDYEWHSTLRLVCSTINISISLVTRVLSELQTRLTWRQLKVYRLLTRRQTVKQTLPQHPEGLQAEKLDGLPLKSLQVDNLRVETIRLRRNLGVLQSLESNHWSAMCPHSTVAWSACLHILPIHEYRWLPSPATGTLSISRSSRPFC